MALAEAVARGLPIVATSAGAVSEWLSPECALMVPVGDHDALSGALARVLGDASLRSAMSASAVRAAAALPTWEACGQAVAAALSRRLAARSTRGRAGPWLPVAILGLAQVWRFGIA
jgi:glycosyltransferase involved in cell wall biosynthesis